MKCEAPRLEETLKKLAKIFPSHSRYFKSIFVRASNTESGEDKRTKFELMYLEGEQERTIVSTKISGNDIRWAECEFAKYAFLNLVADKLNYRDLADHYYKLISSIYRISSLEHNHGHSLIKYASALINPKGSIFSAVINEDALIFLPDGSEVEEFSYKPLHCGSKIIFCKTSSMAFNKSNLISSLLLNPAFAHSNDLYMKALGVRKPEKIYDAIDLLETGEHHESYDLKRKILEVTPGDGLAFEVICEELLSYVFSCAYSDLNLKKQVSSYGGIRRRDFVIANFLPDNPVLHELKISGVDYILFDAKNYDNPMSASDLDTFFSYIQEQPRFGKFGIILSKKGINQKAKEQLFYRFLSKNDEVIVLDEKDLIQLVDLRATARDPMLYIQEKINHLRLQR